MACLDAISDCQIKIYDPSVKNGSTDRGSFWRTNRGGLDHVAAGGIRAAGGDCGRPLVGADVLIRTACPGARERADPEPPACDGWDQPSTGPGPAHEPTGAGTARAFPTAWSESISWNSSKRLTHRRGCRAVTPCS